MNKSLFDILNESAKELVKDKQLFIFISTFGGKKIGPKIYEHNVYLNANLTKRVPLKKMFIVLNKHYPEFVKTLYSVLKEIIIENE